MRDARDEEDGPPARCGGCGAPGLAGDRFCEECGARRDDPRDRVEIVLADVAGVSDRGHRHRHNEDALALRTLPSAPGEEAVRLAVLCDGVSSAPRPDLASLVATDAAITTLTDLLAREARDPGAAIEAAAHAAAAAVVEMSAAARLPRRSACTFVAAVVVGGTATIGWLGDSRAYWLPAGDRSGTRLTVDDSWFARTVATGRMSREAAAGDRRAHTITGWLGARSTAPDVHVTALRPASSGALVLCTDGLWNDHESPESLAAALTGDPGRDPIGAARELVASALDGGGHDNITVAVLPITAPAPAWDDLAS